MDTVPQEPSPVCRGIDICFVVVSFKRRVIVSYPMTGREWREGLPGSPPGGGCPEERLSSFSSHSGAPGRFYSTRPYFTAYQINSLVFLTEIFSRIRTRYVRTVFMLR